MSDGAGWPSRNCFYCVQFETLLHATLGASYQPGDYHLRIREFHAWRDRLESIGVRVWNSPALVRWNADKRYLLDLTRRGIATIPTAIVGARCSRDVERIAASEGWQRFVVEPASSASGYETHATAHTVTQR